MDLIEFAILGPGESLQAICDGVFVVSSNKHIRIISPDYSDNDLPRIDENKIVTFDEDTPHPFLEKSLIEGISRIEMDVLGQLYIYYQNGETLCIILTDELDSFNSATMISHGDNQVKITSDGVEYSTF